MTIFCGNSRNLNPNSTRYQSLNPEEESILNDLINSYLHTIKPELLEPIACDGFYEGCGCDLCLAQDRYSPFCYPKVI